MVASLEELKKDFEERTFEEIRLYSMDENNEQRIQNYLQGIAQRLLGEEHDFESSPVCFSISDDAQPNAAFMPNTKKDEENKELTTTPMIFVTKGLLDLCENEDQLAFILGHELGHFRQAMLRGDHHNSKAEEAGADFQSVELLANAGYNFVESGKILSKLFGNNTVHQDFLSAILDAHPSSESRMNANDVIVTSKTKEFMKKKNLVAYEIDSTPIPQDVEEIVKNERHISFVEKYLANHNYENLGFEQRAEILVSAINASEMSKTNGWGGTEEFIISSRQQDIYDEATKLVKEVREHLPKYIITQSEYDFCVNSSYRDGTKEQQARRQEIIAAHPRLNIYGDAKKQLDLPPYKVVADDDYESAIEENERLKKELEEKKNNGSFLGMILFEKAYSEGRKIEPYHNQDKYSILRNIYSPALYSLSDIDLQNNSDFWSSFYEAAQTCLTSQEKEDVEAATNHIGILYYTCWVSDTQNPIAKQTQVSGSGYIPFFNRFPEFPQPDLKVGGKAPYIANKDIFEKIFGIQEALKIDDKRSVISHTNTKDKEDMTYYVIDEQRNITEQYSKEEYQLLINKLKEEAKAEVYNSYAEHLREQIIPVREFLKNPDISDKNIDFLNLVKYFTGPLSVSFPKSEDGKEKSMAAKAQIIQNFDESQLSVTKLDLHKDSFYDVQKKCKSLYAKDVDFELESFLSYLSADEQSFLTKYNTKDDEIAFQALREFVDKNAHQPQVFWSSPVKVSPSDDDRKYFENYDDTHHYRFLSSSFYTQSQHQVITKDFLEKVKFDETMHYEKDGQKEWLYGVDASLFWQELEHIEIYIAMEKEKLGFEPSSKADMVDFSAYQPLYLDQFRKIIGTGEFTPNNYARYHELMEAYKNDSSGTRDLSPILRTEVFLSILKNKDNKLSLKDAYPFIKHPQLKNIYIERLTPILAQADNWPQDVEEFAKIAKHLKEEKIIAAPKVVLGIFVDLAHKEKDVAKLQKAILLISESLLNDSNMTEAEQNKIKDKLLNGSILWQQGLDDKILSYTLLQKAGTFSEDFVLQNQILEGFVPEIEKLPSAEERIAKYMYFVSKENRISHPQIRRDFQNLWVKNVFNAIGGKTDDNSFQYHQNIQPYIDSIMSEKIIEKWGVKKTQQAVSTVDRDEIMRLLAKEVVSQEDLSFKLKPEPSGIDAFENGDLFAGHTAGAVFDVIKKDMQSNPQNAKKTIEFLLSQGKRADCESYSEALKTSLKRYTHISSVTEENRISKETSPNKLALLHEEFWGYPLEARAVLINELLSSQTSHSNKEKWESMFDIVSAKMFPNSDESMSNIGKEFLRSYIKSRRSEQRKLYLSAMLVAANENAGTLDPEKSIAKGMRLFLENSGPAAIKLGQAMASHPDVPKFIRDEMQELKSGAAEPSRWELYSWLRQYKQENPNEGLEFGKDTHLGKILGSASYFVTLEKGKDNVIKVLRAGAEVESREEFKIFEKMLYDLSEKGVMENGVDSFVRLVHQAKDAVDIETNMDVGYQQLKTAQDLYPKSVEINNREFKVHVADWPKYGKCWAELEKVQGTDLDKIADASYKKDFSKAYFTVELMNIISGGRFDHDRHGKQLKIDVENNVIGLFDTGAMAVKDPDPQDKELMGRIVFRTLSKMMQSDDADFSKIGGILTSEIEASYKKGDAKSTYLTEVQRGLLALADFYKDFEGKDFIECFSSALSNQDMPVDAHLMKGFIDEGVSSIGLFDARQNLLSHQDKEKLGGLLFNVYAQSLFSGQDTDMKSVLIGEIDKLSTKDSEAIPLLQVIKRGLQDKQSDNQFALGLPSEFLPKLNEVVVNKDVDVAILKGMHREVIGAVNLQQDNELYSPIERQELGKVLYNTFEDIVGCKKADQEVDAISSFKRQAKALGNKSDLVKKLYAVTCFVEQSPVQSEGLDASEVIKSLLLSGNLDKEVTNGVVMAMKEKHSNPIQRKIIEKGLKFFLSQKSQEPSIVKKGLVRMFVKKKSAPLQDIESLMQNKIEDKSLSRAFVGSLLSATNSVSDKISPVGKPVVSTKRQSTR